MNSCFSFTDTVNEDVDTMDTNLEDVDILNLENVKRDMEAITSDMVILGETQIGSILRN